MKNNEGYMEIDLLRLLHALMHKAGVILLVTALLGTCAACYTRFLVAPEYESTTLMYVNNSDSSAGAQSTITSGDLSASAQLVDTYIVILESRSTLEEVIRKADVPYSVSELSKMITASSVNSTEVFEIEVVSENAGEAVKIADTIGEVLPAKIASIVDGSSVRLVDSASVAQQCGPNLVKNAVLGALLGFLLSGAAVIIRELRDRQIHDTEYLKQNYDLPVLAVIPDLSQSMKSKSGSKT